MHCYVVSSVAVTPQPKGLIELIEYSYQQVATSFPEADLERTPKLSLASGGRGVTVAADRDY